MLIRSVLQHLANANLKGKWLKWLTVYTQERKGGGGGRRRDMQMVGCTGMLSEIYNVYKPEIWQVREGARDFLEDQEDIIKHTY